MDCKELLEILDDHALPRLSAARKAQLNDHLAACDACSAQWHSQRAVEDRAIVPMTPTLLAATRRLVMARASQPATHRLVSRFVGAGVLVAGAALATVAIVTQVVRTNREAAPELSPPQTAAQGATGPVSRRAASPVPGDTTSLAELIDRVRAARSAPVPSAPSPESLASPLPDGDYFALLKVPPRYPSEAAERGVEGNVIVEYAVTETGDVEDVEVVESTDPLFDRAAIVAAQQFKYMPRIAGGRAVAVTGVRTRIAFRLRPGDAGAGGVEHDPAFEAPVAPTRPSAAEITGRALDCASSGDLLCAELVLDEASATYQFSAEDQRAMLKAYGFVYARLEDTERAIAAYEAAAAIPGGFPGDTTLLTVAHLYFQRQQYVPALERTLQYIERTSKTGSPVPSALRFAERLQELGAIAP